MSKVIPDNLANQLIHDIETYDGDIQQKRAKALQEWAEKTGYKPPEITHCTHCSGCGFYDDVLPPDFCFAGLCKCYQCDGDGTRESQLNWINKHS